MKTYCRYRLLIAFLYLFIGILVGQGIGNETISVQSTDVTVGINATLDGLTEDAQPNITDVTPGGVTSDGVTRGVDAAENDNTTTGDDNTSSGDNATEIPVQLTTSAQTFSNATPAAGDKSANGTGKDSENTSGNEESGSLASGERLEQVEVLDNCFRMEWSRINFVSSKIQINITNNKTQDKQTFSVDSTDGTLMVCDLLEHQSYLVELTDPGWTPERVIEKFMWTRQITPPFPPAPTLEYTTENSIAIKIYAVNIDLNTGPFSGFNIRLARANESRSSEEPYAYYAMGSPKGFSVALLPNNVDQQFVIGKNDDGGSNVQLKKDTDYEILVGTVSTVAHISTNAYVSIIATTCVINIHVIIMFLCFVVGFALLTYAIAFVVWKRKNEEMKMSKDDDHLMAGESPVRMWLRSQEGDGLDTHKDSTPLAPHSPRRHEGSGD